MIMDPGDYSFDCSMNMDSETGQTCFIDLEPFVWASTSAYYAQAFHCPETVVANVTYIHEQWSTHGLFYMRLLPEIKADNSVTLFFSIHDVPLSLYNQTYREMLVIGVHTRWKSYTYPLTIDFMIYGSGSGSDTGEEEGDIGTAAPYFEIPPSEPSYTIIVDNVKTIFLGRVMPIGVDWSLKELSSTVDTTDQEPGTVASDFANLSTSGTGEISFENY